MNPEPHMLSCVHRLSYTLGRTDKLNFPLSGAERAELDALGVAGVMAQFKTVRQAW